MKTGQTILHYEILEKLGEGGMGIVYKALDTKLNRIVALKFPPVLDDTSSEQSLRFLQEVHALSALNHPNIVTLYDMEEADRQRFIVLEYVDGTTLKERIRGGGLPIDRILDVALQMGRGLAYAHERDIIHRDIKPENILFSTTSHIKIADFGLAKLSNSPKLSRTGSTVGTASYMSPEQARGEHVDARSDIWSFGVILFEMLTGRLPFEGEYETAILYSIINSPHPDLLALRPDCPPRLAAIVDRCLRKEKSERHAQGHELLSDLEGISSSIALDQPRAGQGSSPHERALTKRRKIIIFVTALVVFSASVAPLLYFDIIPIRNAEISRASQLPSPGLIFQSPLRSDVGRVSSFLRFNTQFLAIPDSVCSRFDDEISPRVISLIYPQKMLTMRDASQQLARKSILYQHHYGEKASFFFDTLGCTKAIFPYIVRADSPVQGNSYVFALEMYSYFLNENGEIDNSSIIRWSSIGSIESCASFVEREIRDALDSERKSALQGVVVSVEDNRILFRRSPGSPLQQNAILETSRIYRQDGDGYEARLADIRRKIDYCSRHADWVKHLQQAREDSAWIQSLLDQWRAKKESWGSSGGHTGIELRVVDVFDSTAVAVVHMIQYPWNYVKPGDELYLK